MNLRACDFPPLCRRQKRLPETVFCDCWKPRQSTHPFSGCMGCGFNGCNGCSCPTMPGWDASQAAAVRGFSPSKFKQRSVAFGNRPQGHACRTFRGITCFMLRLSKSTPSPRVSELLAASPERHCSQKLEKTDASAHSLSGSWKCFLVSGALMYLTEESGPSQLGQYASMSSQASSARLARSFFVLIQTGS